MDSPLLFQELQFYPLAVYFKTMELEKEPRVDQVEEHCSGARRPSQDEMASGTELLPRPSDDPRDPLNWPLWLKVCQS